MQKNSEIRNAAGEPMPPPPPPPQILDVFCPTEEEQLKADAIKRRLNAGEDVPDDEVESS
jgi:hypothetical protein